MNLNSATSQDVNRYLFTHFTDNAFNFLDHALDAFPDDLKYSTIHFYSAVELFLKARLCVEHWTQAMMDSPTRARLAQGDFISVPFDKACERLETVANSKLSKDTLRCFDIVRKRRNRNVHFSDRLLAPETAASIAQEQLRAWYFLNKLLTQQWRAHFEVCSAQISHIEERLKRYHDYLLTRYTDLHIDDRKIGGETFSLCEVCRFEAETREGPYRRCVLCERRRVQLFIVYQFPVTDPGDVSVFDDLDAYANDFTEYTVRDWIRREEQNGLRLHEFTAEMDNDDRDAKEMIAVALSEFAGIALHTEPWLLTNALVVYVAACRHIGVSPELERHWFDNVTFDDTGDDGLAVFHSTFSRLLETDHHSGGQR